MAGPIETSLATETVKAVTKAVTARAVEEIRLYRGFKDQREKLKNRLLYIQALLEDLGNQHNVESKLVNLWLEEIKDVTFSAENVMDDYAYEMLRRKIELNINNKPSFKKKCRNFITPSTNPIFFRYRMSHRVSEILSKFDELDKTAQKLGLKPADLSAKKEGPSTMLDTHHHKEFKYDVGKGSYIIGRKLDEEILLPMLLDVTGNEAKHGLPTIAITGFGGFGKTTLARWLYGHNKVGKHFDEKKIWICVSGNINVKNLLKEMVESLTGRQCNLDNPDAIIKSLEKELKEKKFLLVLDDVWDENQRSWDSLKNALQSIGAPPGSVVFMTTRNIEIPKKAGAFYSHPVQGLSEADAWALLKHEIFEETTFPFDSSFENIGRRIVNKCKGVPLSIIVISGLLRSKRNPSEWKPIERSHLWDFQQEDILPSLLLSYNHLGSASVKQCFAYCAIFPQDSLMQRSQLISLWLSQGLLHHHDSEIRGRRLTMEEIGEKYFNILVNHSLLQEEREDGEQSGYKMHDLVHDLASYISRKDVLVLKGGNQIEEASNHRHVVFNVDNNETEVEIPTTVMMVKLRTISFWDETVCRWNSLKSARYIRTLILADMWLSEVPPIVGQLIHLRYLDLSHNYELTALPESICNLYQLQTLRLLECDDLRELPSELHRLENLRHIETSYHLGVSTGLRKLTNLQTLPHLQLCDGKGWTIDELGPLDQVKGDIHIRGLEHVKNREDARKADIGRKEGVLGLNLSWDSARREESNGEDVLGSLEPHSNIKSLCLEGFNGMMFPSWIMTMAVNHGGNNPIQLANLVELELINCKRCQQLPCLGQLPVLRILWLGYFDNVECIGDEFYRISRSNNNKVLFPALKKLQILSFAKLTTWVPPSPQLAAFPSLEILQIRNCQRLEAVPQELLNCTHNLMKLELRNCTGFKQLPTLGHLPNLMTLWLELFNNVECIGEDFYESRSQNINNATEFHLSVTGEDKVLFRALRKLYILSFGKVTTWLPPSLPLQAFPRLEILNIRNCPRLETVPTSHFQSLQLLELVDLGGNQPVDIIRYNQGLNVTIVKGMAIRPQELLNCTHLMKLELRNCTGFKQLPTLGHLPNLMTLMLEGFHDVECIGEDFYERRSQNFNNAADVHVIIGENVLFPALSELRISNFERLTTWMPPSPALAGIAFPSLETLRIAWCPCLETVPASHIQSLKSLTLVKVNGSSQPLDIIKYSHGLISLKVTGLEKMVTLPPELSNCCNLQELAVEYCPSVACIPDGVFQGLSSLRELIIWNCEGLERMPTSLEECTSLKTLRIIDCPLIKGSIPDLSRFHSLEDLSLVESGEWATSWQHGWIPQFHRLRLLSISWFGDEWDFNSTSLLTLTISKFDELEGLPDCIGNLSSLEELWLVECKNLKNLPSKKAMQRLSRLGELRITDCPVLKERCAKDHGPEWINISHIPEIVIDDIDVQG